MVINLMGGQCQRDVHNSVSIVKLFERDLSSFFLEYVFSHHFQGRRIKSISNYKGKKVFHSGETVETINCYILLAGIATYLVLLIERKRVSSRLPDI